MITKLNIQKNLKMQKTTFSKHCNYNVIKQFSHEIIESYIIPYFNDFIATTESHAESKYESD